MSDYCFEKIEDLLKNGFVFAGFKETSGQVQMLFFKPTEDKKEDKEK